MDSFLYEIHYERLVKKANALENMLNAFTDPGYGKDHPRAQQQAELNAWLCYIAQLCVKDIKLDIEELNDYVKGGDNETNKN